ncbi:uncharacterized protein C15orf65 homolog isoform X2 [Mauremys mutica]|uniref:uncharacterized protein C15orf65 homolog isoform X2 n=1 Tax=Mauremys mutica TaxID=74926 RepID=UPI001D157B57|nr:uncharacterized protein C15orf65 homolog isoform X2 [Mauremys mutica]
MRKSNLFNCLPVQILAILCFPASQYFIQRKQMTILETVKETLRRHKRQFDAQLPLKDFQWELSAYHPVIENLSKKDIPFFLLLSDIHLCLSLWNFFPEKLSL